jgi:hypothetical protein
MDIYLLFTRTEPENAHTVNKEKLTFPRLQLWKLSSPSKLISDPLRLVYLVSPLFLEVGIRRPLSAHQLERMRTQRQNSLLVLCIL